MDERLIAYNENPKNCLINCVLRNLRLLEDIFFAVYFGMEDLGLDVTWVRCPNLVDGCATEEALEHRQVGLCQAFGVEKRAPLLVHLSHVHTIIPVYLNLTP